MVVVVTQKVRKMSGWKRSETRALSKTRKHQQANNDENAPPKPIHWGVRTIFT
jgi:hypothetical protein